MVFKNLSKCFFSKNFYVSHPISIIVDTNLYFMLNLMYCTRLYCVANNGFHLTASSRKFGIINLTVVSRDNQKEWIQQLSQIKEKMTSTQQEH